MWTSTPGFIFLGRSTRGRRYSVLLVYGTAVHSYQDMKWRSATWNTARGSRVRRVSAWHLKNLRRRDVFRGSSPPCYRDINRIESDEEERRETSSYISAEETKSAREVYIRVAVIDSMIRAGITNIYIDGRHKDLVLAAAHSRRNVPYRG